MLVDRVLALSPVLERALERLTDSPLVGTMASRFMGRVVGEVVQANQAVADKVPGLGSLMSFGTSAASRMMGAADTQLQGLLGETVGKGGTFAVRRLNKIIVETVRDPTTRDAVLQVWDLAAAGQVGGLSGRLTRAELDGVVDAAHDLVVSTLASEQVAHLGEVVVDGFFERFGGYTPTELLDELDLDRADLVADLVRIAPGVVDALRESGDLERIVRAQLAPFYDSAEVRALLGVEPRPEAEQRAPAPEAEQRAPASVDRSPVPGACGLYPAHGASSTSSPGARTAQPPWGSCWRLSSERQHEAPVLSRGLRRRLSPGARLLSLPWSSRGPRRPRPVPRPTRWRRPGWRSRRR